MAAALEVAAAALEVAAAALAAAASAAVAAVVVAVAMEVARRSLYDARGRTRAHTTAGGKTSIARASCHALRTSASASQAVPMRDCLPPLSRLPIYSHQETPSSHPRPRKAQPPPPSQAAAARVATNVKSHAHPHTPRNSSLSQMVVVVGLTDDHRDSLADRRPCNHKTYHDSSNT